MPRAVEATCVAGIVKVGALAVPGTVILSEGVASSSGILVIDGDKKYYVAKTSPDLKTTLEKLVSVLGQLVTGLTALDAKPVGGVGSAPAPAAAAVITQLGVIQAEVTALKEALK